MPGSSGEMLGCLFFRLSWPGFIWPSTPQVPSQRLLGWNLRCPLPCILLHERAQQPLWPAPSGRASHSFQGIFKSGDNAKGQSRLQLRGPTECDVSGTESRRPKFTNKHDFQLPDFCPRRKERTSGLVPSRGSSFAVVRLLWRSW